MGGATSVAQSVGIFNPLGGGIGPFGDKSQNLGEFYFFYFFCDAKGIRDWKVIL
jgi:hypothetical protein